MLDPAEERPALKWLGGLGVADLERLLDDGARAVRARRLRPADAALVRADRVNGEGRPAEAAPLYREALARGGPGWAGRGRAVDALLLALTEAEDWQGCAREGEAQLPPLPRGASFANGAALALSCALSAPDDAPWRPAALDRLEALAREGLSAPGALADDVAGLHEELVQAREARGDRAGAREAARRWWRWLEERSARAATPEERASFDSARVSAALALGDPALAVPALRAAERALPADYDPPARLAFVYRELGRQPEALAEAKRALERAYGPRKLRVYELETSILARLGDRAGEEAALAEALAYGEALPDAQRGPGERKLLDRLRSRLGQVDGRTKEQP